MQQDRQPNDNREVSLDEWEKLTFERYGVPENLRQSILGQESAGGTQLESPTKVKGRYMVTRATASQYGYDRDDPWQQPVAAAKHLRTLYDGVKQRHPDFDDKVAWLGASAEYYYGGNAFDKDGNLSDQSRDGYSTPAKYAQGIAEKWSAFDKGGSSQTRPPQSAARRLGIKPAEGMNFDLSGGSPSVGPNYWDASPEAAKRVLQERHEAGLTDARAKRREEVAKSQENETPGTRYVEALGRGGLALSRMARQATQLGTAINRKIGMPAPPNDDALNAWQAGEEQALRYAQERQAARPSSFATDVAEGVIEGAPTAAAALGGGLLTGGGLPVAMAIGGGMGAAGADWKDPQRAALQAGIGAVAPIVGGQIGSKLGGAVASRLASPVARALAAGGGEIAGGAAGNVLGKAADVGIFEGRMITPGEAAREATIGGALNVPGAYGAGRAARATAPMPAGTTAPLTGALPNTAQPINGVRVFRQGEQIPARARNERQIAIDLPKPDGSVETVMAIAPRGMNEQQIRAAAEQAANPAEQASSTFDDVIADSQSRIQQHLADGDTNAVDVELSVLDQSIKDQYNEAVKVAKGNPAARAAAQRVRAQQQRAADGVKQQAAARVQELAQPTEPLQGTESFTEPTAELTARIPDAPGTQQFRTPEGAIIAGPSSLPSRRLLNPAPSGPETQQIPGVPRTIQAADEPTGRFQTGRLPVAAENAPTSGLPLEQMQRRTAETLQQPVINRPETGRTIPQRQQAQRVSSVDQVRQTAGLPRSRRQPELVPETGQRQQSKSISTVDDFAPTNRITSGAGDELQRYSRPLEGQPIELPRAKVRAPRATVENIDDLRARYAELDRLRYDRRGDFTGDLRDEARELGSVIADYDNRQAKGVRGNRFDSDAEPPYAPQGREKPMTPEEKAARRLALQPRPRTSGLLQSSTPGRPVTQEMQIPSARDVGRDFNSREDARRGHFDTFDDAELVQEIDRLTDERNNAIRGKSKLSREELAANNFDLKIAVEQQKERGVVQRAQGREPSERIAPRTPGARPKKQPRVIQHETFGEVKEAADQKGVGSGKLRVTDTDGGDHIIQNPRTAGNRNAAFAKKQLTEELIPPPPVDEGPIPDTAMPEIMEQRARQAQRAKPKFVADAEQRLKDAASGRLAGSGTRQLTDTTIVAGWKVYETGMDFAAWSKEVVRQVGEKVRPHLRAAWQQIQADYKQMERESTTPRAGRSPESATRVPLRADVRALAHDYQGQKRMIPAGELKKLGLAYDLDYQGGEIERPMSLSIDDIVLGRDDLSPDRLFKVSQAMAKGGLPAGADVDPIMVSYNPKTGKWAASDGNHRIALLKLAGYKGKVDVVAEVSNAQQRERQGFSVGSLPDETKGGTALGSLGGSLQGMFKARKAPVSNPTKADIEGASLGNAIGNVLRTGAQGLRTVKTAFDLSAPFGQAAFLTIPHPLKSAQAFGKMMRSLNRNQSDAIDAEIAFHPLRKLGEEAGLYLATSAKLKGDAAGGEEAFMVRGLNRVPGIGASERTYRTYLDTLRMSVWEGYVKSLQADGYTFENNPKAYKDAAAGINIASGRGSINKGGKIEKAMDLGGDILFSPRNFVAKFQRLDPVRYARLAPGARKLVLKDALTTFGAMLGTAALFRAAGSSVSLDPESDDFMIVRRGDTRYDLTFGAKTQVQFLARMAMGTYRKKTGEGNLPYKDPIQVASSFMRNQLAPGVSLAIDAFKGEDFKGEKFSEQSPGKIAREAIAPMMVEDFYEAYEKEGKAGIAKTLPAILGARVNTYPDKAKADWVDTPPEMRAEQKKSGETRSYLSPKRGEAGNKADDETPGQFAARKAVVNEWTTKYGKDLVSSQAYRSATAAEQKAARDYLERTITGQSDEKWPSLYLLNPARILATIRQSERDKKRKAARSAM